jgi:hypothetical protein
MKSPVYAIHSRAHTLSTHWYPTTGESVGQRVHEWISRPWRSNVVTLLLEQRVSSACEFRPRAFIGAAFV